MCTVNHATITNAGYVFAVGIESIAPRGALFTRMLAHHRDVGLSLDQVQALLDLNREYHERQVAIQIEFMRVSEALDIRNGRFDAASLAEKEPLVRKHADLFGASELLFFEMARRGHEILTDEQIERAEHIYASEHDATMRHLAPIVERALAAAPTKG